MQIRLFSIFLIRKTAVYLFFHAVNKQPINFSIKHMISSLLQSKNVTLPILATITTTLALYLYFRKKSNQQNSTEKLAQLIIKLKQKLTTNYPTLKDVEQVLIIAEQLSDERVQQRIKSWKLQRARGCGNVKKLMEEENMTEIEGGCSKKEEIREIIIENMKEYIEKLRSGIDEIWNIRQKQIIRVGQTVGMRRSWLQQYKQTILVHLSTLPHLSTELISSNSNQIISEIKQQIKWQISFNKQKGNFYTQIVLQSSKHWDQQQKNNLRALLPLILCDFASIPCYKFQSNTDYKCEFNANHHTDIYNLESSIAQILTAQLQQLQISTTPLILQINKNINKTIDKTDRKQQIDEIGDMWIGQEDRQRLSALQYEQMKKYREMGEMLGEKGMSMR